VAGAWEGALRRLPDELVAEAHFSGSGDPLWPAAAALRILPWAVSADHAVAGGEVYRKLGPMQTSFVDDWETSRTAGEPWQAYVRRAARRAGEEIARFANDGGLDLRYYLVLTAVDEEPAPW
jgi:hypothetical protein